MKLGVVIFHKNPFSIYDKRWIEKSLESIINQSVKSLNFYEIDYSGKEISLLGDYNLKNLKYYSQKMSNYAEAMNFIISEAFQDGCEYVFNTNIDDYYTLDRVEKQLNLMESGNYDIVSSDFCYIKETINGDGKFEDVVFHLMNIYRRPEDIIYYLRKNSNVIAHPSVCYSKRFWKNNKYDSTKTPKEDLHLWKKSIEKGYKFAIHPEILLYYRIHKNQVSNKNGI
jgi:hypothetical protein